jgi:hypothetical protein
VRPWARNRAPASSAGSPPRRGPTTHRPRIRSAINDGRVWPAMLRVEGDALGLLHLATEPYLGLAEPLPLVHVRWHLGGIKEDDKVRLEPQNYVVREKRVGGRDEGTVRRRCKAWRRQQCSARGRCGAWRGVAARVAE